MDRAKLDLLKRTICKGSTDDEFQMFMTYCDKYHLDPNSEVDFIIYKNKKTGGHTVSIRPNVKGMLKVAQRADDWEGIVSCVIRKNDQIHVDMPNHHIDHTFDSIVIKDRGGIVGAWAKTYRQGMKPFLKTITLEEYYNEDNEVWKKYMTDMCENTAKRKVLQEAYGIDEWHSDPNKAAKPVRGLLPEPVGIPIPELLPEGKKEDMAVVVEDFSKESYDLEFSSAHPKEPILSVKEQVKAAEKEHFALEGLPIPILPSNPSDAPKEVDPIKNLENVFSFDEPPKKTIVLRDKDPVEQLDADIDNMIQEEDLDIFETLSAKTQEQFGDDWYCSMTAKTKEKQDVPLHFLRYLVDTEYGSPNNVEALYQVRLKTKERTMTLLALYHGAVIDYHETNHKPMMGIISKFIERMDLVFRKLDDVERADLTIEQVFNNVKDLTGWSDDWTTWAVGYLKKRKLI